MTYWTWTGGGGSANTDWTNPGNWAASETWWMNGYPNGEQDVYFNTTAIVTLSAAPAAIANLYINADVSITGGYTIQINSLTVAAGDAVRFGLTTQVRINGIISVSGTGTATISGGVLNTGYNVLNIGTGSTMKLTGGAVVDISSTTGGGTVLLDGATLNCGTDGPQTVIQFVPGSSNTLLLPTWYNTRPVIVGFGAGDVIKAGSQTLYLYDTGTKDAKGNEIYDLSYSNSWNSNTGTVTLAPGTQVQGDTGAGSYVTLSGDNSSGFTICYYAGTMIATPEGETAVEDLKTGDLVRLADGRAAPVRWVGWSQIAMRFADPLRTLPIRIKAGALADGVPARDLLVSPDHAVFIDDVLVQASALVNGSSILREEDVPESFRYYHVELATHELLLAENCPAESFVDNIDRMHFHNWDAREAPAEAVVEMDLPRAKSARQVPVSIRNAIAARTMRHAA